MRRTWIALAAVVLAAASCSSCGASKAAQRGQPVMGTTDLVTSLDPAEAYDEGSWQVFGNTFQTLLDFPPGSDQPVPDAASGCRFTDKAYTTYQCTVRDGLHFSNGDDVTAADVAYSFQRIKRINSPKGPGPLLSTLTSVEAAGRQVTFHLAAPDATWPSKLATGAGAIVDHRVYPMDRTLTGNRLVGSGVYQVKDYVPGKKLVLTPNARYRGAANRVNDGAVIRYYATPDQLASALHKHDVDFVPNGLPPTAQRTYESGSAGFQTVQQTSTDTHLLVFDTTRAPFTDPNVRRAVAQVVDRQALARDVYLRTVQPLYSLIPQGVVGATTAFFDRYGAAPDTGKARALLNASGVHVPVSFTLTVASGSAVSHEADALQSQLNKSGLFSVTVKHVAWSDFAPGFAAHRFDAFTVSWSPDYPDPDDFIAPLIGSASVFHTGYSNSTVDRLISQTRAAASRPDTAGSFAHAQDLEAADAPILPLWQGKSLAVSRSAITGASLSRTVTGVTCLWVLGVGSAA